MFFSVETPVVGPTLDTSVIKQAVNSYIAMYGGDCRDLAFTSLQVGAMIALCRSTVTHIAATGCDR